MNSNGFGIGLGVGMLLGYRSGFLARPYSNTHGYNTYEDIHRREKYNRRKDGLLECAVANTTVYVKKLINIQGKINLHTYGSSVMRVGSDTFGDPIFQKDLQN